MKYQELGEQRWEIIGSGNGSIWSRKIKLKLRQIPSGSELNKPPSGIILATLSVNTLEKRLVPVLRPRSSSNAHRISTLNGQGYVSVTERAPSGDTWDFIWSFWNQRTLCLEVGPHHNFSLPTLPIFLNWLFCFALISVIPPYLASHGKGWESLAEQRSKRLRTRK